MWASLDKLPDELLKLIIDYVEAADQSWRDLKLAQALPEQRVDVAKGQWSSWYGRGVFALAHVDKRWNALARPILFKSINLYRIGSEFFQLHILAEPLGQHVQHLCLDVVSTAAVPHLALAGALRKLPCLTSITLSHGVLRRLTGDARLSSLAREVEARLWTALGTAITVELQPDSLAELENVAQRIHTTRLRSLTVDLSLFTGASGERSPPETVQLLAGLRSLSISNVKGPHTLTWLASTVLPRLRTLSVHAAWPLEQSLRLAADLAPNIAKLSVSVIGSSRVASFPEALDLPSPSFSRLRLLNLDGPSTFPTGLLFLSLCKLEALRVKLVQGTDYGDEFLCVTSPFPSRFPVALREILVESPAGARVFGLDAFETACGQHDVSLVAGEYFTPAPCRRASERPIWPPLEPGQVDLVEETLSWAMERTRWLEELEDGPGMQEMAEAVERLRERRAIERS
ncbi:hypothetical protein JCM9279_000515 [Rhodotorula babjevae]